MGRADYYKPNDYNAICDRCGFKFKASDLKKEWTGWMVCDSCWEPRHPQEFLRGKEDNSNVPWSRPDSNADTNVTTVDGKSLFTVNCSQPNSIPGQAVPGCAIPGWSKGYTNPL